MHVLVTADTVGGVWTYTRELVTGLVRRGARVTLVSFGEIPAAAQADWLDGLRGVDYRPTAFRLEWMQEAEEDLEASSDFLLGVIRDTKPDLLHLNQYAYGALPVEVPKVVVAHSDVVSWWVAVHGEEPRETRWLRWYRDTVTRGISNAQAVVAPSRCMLENVPAYYTRPAQSAVIYNGRNPGFFNPHCTKEEMVVAVGRRWDGGKQISLLTDHDHRIAVCIAGNDQHPDSTLRGGAAALNPGRRKIEFRGPQSEAQLVQLYGRASIYAATSRYEPFGLAPVEAALSRCAIVANDIPSFHEIWGETACYFRYNDSADLARQIERLHGDRELRLTYANLAYHRARSRFTAERMVDDYMNLYQSLVQAGAAVA
ncbi:MAG TPA: glycosyltransferase family 4 protein [Terriglobales bacterium]|nr:glycosyltransferase family 4 protein [Terriglobales bacterium]